MSFVDVGREAPAYVVVVGDPVNQLPGPGIAELAATGRIDIGADFAAGLEAILDSLERMRETP